MSEWLFDLGNSRLKFAPLLDDGRVGEMAGIEHDGLAFAADWEARLPPRIEAAHVASVASDALRTRLLEALAARSGRVDVARTQSRRDGLEIAYADPSRLGVDRFLALLAAHARGGAWLVAGVGTALTVDLLDAAGRHVGGRIAPSPTQMREALHGRARQLPVEGGRYLPFAGDTDDALASGCLGAALGLLAHSRDAAAQRLGAPVPLLLHGGGAAALAPHLEDAVTEPALVLHGLARWARPGVGGP